MHKNLCDCGYNFGTMETFEAHRVGEFGNGRRCLTALEMEKRGWELSHPLLSFSCEGKSCKKAFPTWMKPFSEKRLLSFETLKNARTKGADF